MNNYTLSIQLPNMTTVLLNKPGFESVNKQTICADEWKVRRSEIKFQKTDIFEKDTGYNVHEYDNVTAGRNIPGLNRSKHCQINVSGGVFWWLCEVNWSTDGCQKIQLGSTCNIWYRIVFDVWCWKTDKIEVEWRPMDF